jgi:DNA polymerase-3 subunit chi
MTEVSFHFNVPDRLDYVCRFLRKAVRKGATVVVHAAPPTLAALDRALWSFDPIDFVPHVRLQPGEAPPTRLASTPVWLAESGTDPGHHDVLLNLCDDPPAGFESYARVIEIVSREPGQREAARLRWKHYAGRGYPIVRHEVND